jgi:hypothetical protein
LFEKKKKRRRERKRERERERERGEAQHARLHIYTSGKTIAIAANIKHGGSAVGSF